MHVLMGELLMRSDITARQLRGFVEICRRGGVTVAAERLGMTQSGLSLALQSLERAMGAKLIARSSRQHALTEAGKRLLPLAERILDDLDLAFLSTAEDGPARSRITVAALPTLASTLLPGAIKRFKESHPQTIVAIRDALTEEIVRRVHAGDAHVGIGAFPGRGEDLLVHSLLRDRLTALVARAGALPKGRSLTWRALARHPLILMTRDSNIRGLVDSAFARQRLEVRPAYEVAYISTAVALASAGLGVAVVPELEANAFASPGLRAIKIVDAPVWRDIGILMRQSATPSAPVQAFVAALRAHCAAADDGGGKRP
jgi:DNA-binding transcriptional LysR family regulator